MSDKLAYHAKKMNAINKSKDSFYRSFGSEICEIAEALYDTILRLQVLENGCPSAEPEIKPISYMDCANAMLKMWIDNVLTDGEYNRIMEKLNSKHMADMRGEQE